ncbi:MAG TPA: terminase family protein, partial [Sphingomonadaceae bacterium]|nr:terminase family protein [Sphingomonadaceae bacterium]
MTAEFIASLSRGERVRLPGRWSYWRRKEQKPPRGDWRLWLILAGRGFGKTRAGAEWVLEVARTCPDARIALVAASLAEARAVMVEGESGVLACAPARRRPQFEPSLRRLSWRNGAIATLYSAGEADSLRGPQHSHAWADEIAKWDAASAEAAWVNLQLGLRLGETPRVLATTTPRAVPLVHRLVAECEAPDGVLTRGTTWDNKANLPPRFIGAMRRAYGGSALGRQELEGELLAEVDGALWSRALIEQCRMSPPPLQG